jgi:hypothetical protein
MIDHNAENIYKAIDMSDKELNTLMEKCSSIVKLMEDGEDKISQVYENVLKSLSYNELVFLSTQNIVGMYKDYYEKKMEMILKKLDEHLKDL